MTLSLGRASDGIYYQFGTLKDGDRDDEVLLSCSALLTHKTFFQFYTDTGDIIMGAGTDSTFSFRAGTTVDFTGATVISPEVAGTLNVGRIDFVSSANEDFAANVRVNGAGSALILETSSAHPFQMYTNGAQRISISETGTVQISGANLTVDGRHLLNEIDALEDRIETNETNITTNTLDIATNVIDIATNAGDIATLDGRVTQNEADITTNTGDIATLDGRITQNEADIVTLDGDVTQAEADIVTLDGRVTQNEADIVTLDGDVTQAEADIATNTGDIATNTGDIATNTGDIATNTGDIAALDVRVTQNEADIAGFSSGDYFGDHFITSYLRTGSIGVGGGIRYVLTFTGLDTTNYSTAHIWHHSTGFGRTDDTSGAGLTSQHAHMARRLFTRIRNNVTNPGFLVLGGSHNSAFNMTVTESNVITAAVHTGSFTITGLTGGGPQLFNISATVEVLCQPGITAELAWSDI